TVAALLSMRYPQRDVGHADHRGADPRGSHARAHRARCVRAGRRDVRAAPAPVVTAGGMTSGAPGRPATAPVAWLRAHPRADRVIVAGVLLLAFLVPWTG